MKCVLTPDGRHCMEQTLRVALPLGGHKHRADQRKAPYLPHHPYRPQYPTKWSPRAMSGPARRAHACRLVLSVYPYLFQSGHLFLPTFGVLAALGLMLALTLSLRTAAWAGLPPEAVWNAGLFAVIAAFLSSRLLLIVENLHSFAVAPLLLLEVPSLTAAGLLATLIATGIWLRFHHLCIQRTLDAWAPCATLTWAFLALGHFAEGSDPGLPTRFGIRMPGESTPLVPVALYVAAYALILTAILIAGLRRHRRPGEIAGIALALAGAGQFLLGFVRQPELNAITSILDPLQWVALGLILAGAITVALADDTPTAATPQKEVLHAL